MEVRAAAKYIRISPRKARLMMNQIRGKKAEEALNLLSFSPQKSAFLLRKLINSAVANASENAGMDVDNLYIKKLFSDE